MRASSGDDYNIKRPFIIINNGLVFNILFYILYGIVEFL